MTWGFRGIFDLSAVSAVDFLSRPWYGVLRARLLSALILRRYDH